MKTLAIFRATNGLRTVRVMRAAAARTAVVLAAALLAAATLLGCESTDTTREIDLTDLQPLDTIASQSEDVFRVAVGNILGAEHTIASYAPMCDYISERLQRPVEIVQRRTYSETNELIRGGVVDLAFICTAAYVSGHDDFGLHLVAAPEVRGETVYYSQLIVPARSSVNRVEDLRGLTFAFTDPLSSTGCLYPASLARQLGSTPEEFFSQIVYTYSHDDAIRAVRDGLTDAAAVHNLVLHDAMVADERLRSQLRIIHTSPPFATPPVVVPPNTAESLQVELRAMLLQMHKDPQASRALEAMGVDRFVTTSDDAYESVRKLLTDTMAP